MQHRAGGLTWAIAAGLSIASASFAATAPVVPGFTRLKDDGKKSPAEQGQVLLGELNCAQCHAAPDAPRVLTKGAPDLSNIGARATASYLKAYLMHPHDVKPGTSMPDLFHASDPNSRDGAVDFLVQYLVSLGGPMKPAEEEGLPALVEAGRKLYHEVGCVACHAPEKSNPTKVPSVPLPDLAKKTTIDQLATFLLNPLKDRPASRMPNLGLTSNEANAISVYLLRDQLTNPKIAANTPTKVHGVKYEYFEEHVANVSQRALAKFTPKSTGHRDDFKLDIPNRRGDWFVVRFTASIAIPKDGRYTFYTTSDDGSRLLIDNRNVVNNDGDHGIVTKNGAVQLTAGEHLIVVNYFQQAGDAALKVEWAGPGIERTEIPRDVLYRAGGKPMVPIDDEPITLDPQKVQMGGRMFSMLGCASCHTIPNQQSARTAKALSALNIDSDTGCLGGHIAKGIPNYDLSDEQRVAIKAALTDASLKKPFEPKEQVVHTMAAMNCFACHIRDGIGGPPSDRNELFVMSAPFDMGDEGRVPPRLDHAGLKLLPDAMKQIIFEGKLHVRPVLATRMPMWSTQVLGTTVDSFQQADAEKEPPQPQFSEQAVKDGRQLVGIRGGLGCINCHSMNGYKSLGMPGPDLGTIHDRIRITWFNQWLDNPPALVPGTRMPQFWVGHAAPLKDVGGGTEDSQLAVIWTYFSLGKNAALPSGLAPSGGFELIPDMPIVHRTFMTGVGPRAILVGYPEMVHVAFDADTVRMAKAWRGKFFDASGMWEGRGGNWNGPLGTDIIDMPAGPSFAVLDSPAAAWPKIVPTEHPPANEKYRNVGGHFKGYELDKQERPTFHYVLDDVNISESPIPVQMPTKSNLIRRLAVSAKTAPKNLYFMAASGKKIEAKSPGVWVVDGTMTITIKSADKLDPTLRDSDGNAQLLIPVNLSAGNAAFDVEMSW